MVTVMHKIKSTCLRRRRAGPVGYLNFSDRNLTTKYSGNRYRCVYLLLYSVIIFLYGGNFSRKPDAYFVRLWRTRDAVHDTITTIVTIVIHARHRFCILKGIPR